MPIAYRTSLERLRYWQGQSLRSSDARDQQRTDALRRRLHNRALHTTDGVAFGMMVILSSDDPAVAEVACGLAYDMRGQELILQRRRLVALPATDSQMLLCAGVRPAAKAGSQPRDGCAQMLDQEIELVWRAAAAIDPTRHVLLARFSDGALDSAYVPRRARPIARPRLATGATIEGDTAWEPWVVERTDAAGTIVSQTAGVQTHIDTSASGFTATPRYIATLQAQPHAWDPDRAEFAPAFFGHVAKPTADGFIFRLLMTSIARRRYSAWMGVARVSGINHADGNRLLAEVDTQAAFKAGDMVAQLRPRANAVVVIKSIDDNSLTLAAALDDDAEMLAVANLPRVATVQEVLPEDKAMLADFSATHNVKKGDLLQRSSDGATAMISRVSQGTLTVPEPFSTWLASDSLRVASIGAGAQVKLAALEAGGTSLALELKPASHALEAGMAIVLLDGETEVLATIPAVASRSGATIKVPPPAGLDLTRVARAAPLLAISIASLRLRSPGTVRIDVIDAFDVDDYVALAGQSPVLARVTHIDRTRRELGLSAALPVQMGSLIVGANWTGVTTVDEYPAGAVTQVKVGRRSAAFAGDYVSRLAAGAFTEPVPVTGASGLILTLAKSLPGASRFDTLAVAAIPRLATVLAQDAQGLVVTVAESGALRPGDSVLVMPAAGAAAATRAVLHVAGVSGNTVVLASSPGTLAPGDRLATLHWRDMVEVTKVDPVAGEKIEVASAAGLRPGDLTGKLAYYADCSNPGYVEKIAGNVLTLLPGFDHGDGISPQGWVDGGIVGPAAVSLPAPPVPPFPQWQPLVRLENTEGLEARSTATAHGFDLMTGKFQSRTVLPAVLPTPGAQVVLLVHGTEPYRFRPETLSLVTGFNEDFPRAFASFAQKQKLVVRWIGCQDDQPQTHDCPAQSPFHACGPAAAAANLEEM